MLDKKYPRLILLLLVILLLVIGYRYWQGHNQAGNKNTPGQTKQSITVIDNLGRKVQVPVHVERVACLYAFSGHVTAMLGEGDKIVAIPDGLKKDVLLNEMYPEIGNALKIQAYAMIMELINNIIRHSECQKASVQIHFDDGVMDIRVEDDGKGFVADINQSGTGLKNLISRVKSVNGSLKISNGLKHGVTVHISIPLGSNGTEQSSE